MKEFHVAECTFIYRNISYYPNMNLVSGLILQLHMQLWVFTPIFWVMLITVLAPFKVDNWLRSNKLSLNYSKSKFMLTKSWKNNSNLLETYSFQIKINDSYSQRTRCTKYLGVLIDGSLDWSSHVQYIKSKLVRASYLFYKIRNVVSIDVSKTL